MTLWPAAVADAGQGVVLGEDGDGAGSLVGAAGSRVSSGGPGDLCAQGGVHAVDADLGLDAVAAQELGDRGHGVVLLVAGLGMVVDVMGEIDDLRGQLGDGLPQGGAQGGGGSGVVGQGRCRADDAAALLGLGSHALLDGAGGDGGAGQVVQVAHGPILAQPASPRSVARCGEPTGRVDDDSALTFVRLLILEGPAQHPGHLRHGGPPAGQRHEHDHERPGVDVPGQDAGVLATAHPGDLALVVLAPQLLLGHLVVEGEGLPSTAAG